MMRLARLITVLFLGFLASAEGRVIEASQLLNSTCPGLKVPENGRLIGDCLGATKDQKCAFECDKYFELKGDSLLTCKDNLEWDKPVPACKGITCPELTNPESGRTFGVCLGAVKGQKCSVLCEPNYTVIGQSMLTCKDNLQWDRPLPSCKALSCGDQLPGLNKTYEDYCTEDQGCVSKAGSVPTCVDKCSLSKYSDKCTKVGAKCVNEGQGKIGCRCITDYLRWRDDIGQCDYQVGFRYDIVLNGLELPNVALGPIQPITLSHVQTILTSELTKVFEAQELLSLKLIKCTPDMIPYKLSSCTTMVYFKHKAENITVLNEQLTKRCLDEYCALGKLKARKQHLEKSLVGLAKHPCDSGQTVCSEHAVCHKMELQINKYWCKCKPEYAQTEGLPPVECRALSCEDKPANSNKTYAETCRAEEECVARPGSFPKCTDKCLLAKYSEKCTKGGGVCVYDGQGETACQCATTYLRWNNDKCDFQVGYGFDVVLKGIRLPYTSSVYDPFTLRYVEKIIEPELKSIYQAYELLHLRITKCDPAPLIKNPTTCNAVMYFKEPSATASILKGKLTTKCTGEDCNVGNLKAKKYSISSSSFEKVKHPCDSGQRVCQTGTCRKIDDQNNQFLCQSTYTDEEAKNVHQGVSNGTYATQDLPVFYNACGTKPHRYGGGRASVVCEQLNRICIIYRSNTDYGECDDCTTGFKGSSDKTSRCEHITCKNDPSPCTSREHTGCFDDARGRQCYCYPGYKEDKTTGKCAVARCADYPRFCDHVRDTTCHDNETTGPQCDCKGGFMNNTITGMCEAEKCREYPDLCDWLEHTVCRDDVRTGPQCHCKDGFKVHNLTQKCTVRRCSDAPPPCAGQHNTVCTDDAKNGPKCMCKPGFHKAAGSSSCTVKKCHDNPDECALRENTVCRDDDRSGPRCDCKKGFVRNNTTDKCTVIKCRDNPYPCAGQVHTVCRDDTSNGPQCDCKTGFKRDPNTHKCTVRKCLDSPGPCVGQDHTVCRDDPENGPQCDCKGGFQRDSERGQCRVSQCEDNPTICVAQKNTVCFDDENNGPRCICQTGFKIDSSTRKCTAKTCSDHEIVELGKTWEHLCNELNRECNTLKGATPTGCGECKTEFQNPTPDDVQAICTPV